MADQPAPENDVALWPTRPVADGDYWLQRALAESRMAEQATSPAAETAHHVLANFYLGELFGAAESRLRQAPGEDDPRRHQALFLEQVGHRLAAAPPVAPMDELTKLLEKIW